jgi:hypothetical protein
MVGWPASVSDVVVVVVLGRGVAAAGGRRPWSMVMPMHDHDDDAWGDVAVRPSVGKQY